MPNAPSLSPGGGEPPSVPPPAAKISPKSNGQLAQRPTTLGVQSMDGKMSISGGSPQKKTSIGGKPVANELTHISSIDFPPADEEWEQLREQNTELKLKIDYCWTHMSDQLEVLQRLFTTEQLTQEDNAMVALAELKKCRDVLKGTLKFTPNKH